MSETESYAYAIGRKIDSLQEPFRGTDSLYAAVRLDGTTISGADFQHCTFSNISFKDAIIDSGKFLNCVFVGCYFRRAKLNDTSFAGCRFIDCHFGHVRIGGSRFEYSSFRGCHISFDEMFFSLPPQPYVKEILARNLAIESTRLGLPSEARRYRREEIKAHEAHLRAAVVGQSQWYQEHFSGGYVRTRALSQLLASLLNRWFWGYGERVWLLLGNVVFFALIVFPLFFYLYADGLVKHSGGEIGVPDLLRFSIENILPVTVASGVEAGSYMAQLLAAAESIFGLLVLALFGSHIVRWSLRR